jgi:hypothetical protein
MNQHQQSPFDLWRQYHYVYKQQYQSGQISYIPNLLPEIAVQLNVYDIFEILQRRLGSEVLQKALDPNQTIESPVRHHQDGSWLKKSKMVGVNIRTIHNFFNLVKYTLTIPKSQDSIHILPIWEPGVVSSLYGKVSFNINPEFYSEELARAVPHLNTVEKQLKVTTNLLHAMGKSVGMDVIPHNDRFSELVIAYPRFFEWVRRVGGRITNNSESIYREIEEIIWHYLGRNGSGNGSPLSFSKNTLFSPEIPILSDAQRLEIIFGNVRDYKGRLRRRVEIMQDIINQGFETLPMTMAPPYRGLHINPDDYILDENGNRWYTYEFDKPQAMSRVFGPLTRFKFFHSKEDNAKWELDFNNPQVSVWNYVCTKYHECQQNYNFDFMRGDMAHIQPRPHGVPEFFDSGDSEILGFRDSGDSEILGFRDSGDSEILGFRDSGDSEVLGFRDSGDSEVLGFRDSGDSEVLGFRDSGDSEVLGFRDSGDSEILGFRDSEVLGFRDSGDSEILGFFDSEIIELTKSQNQRIPESKNHGISESQNQRIKESKNHGISEPQNQRIPESKNHGIPESQNQRIKESKNHGISESQNLRIKESKKYYDPLLAIKKYVQQNGTPHFGFFAETFLVEPDFMGYGDELDHLEAIEADSTLGDLQASVVGSDDYNKKFRDYTKYLQTRKFAPSYTIITADKDDPRFDEFYRTANHFRYFIGTFLTDMPSYMGLGFETRNLHLERGLNEEYSKLYVFTIHDDAQTDKVTHGSYIWGQNYMLFGWIEKMRELAEKIWDEINGKAVNWLTNPTENQDILIWTPQDTKYVFVAKQSPEYGIDESIISQTIGDSARLIFDTTPYSDQHICRIYEW